MSKQPGAGGTTQLSLVLAPCCRNSSHLQFEACQTSWQTFQAAAPLQAELCQGAPCVANAVGELRQGVDVDMETAQAVVPVPFEVIQHLRCAVVMWA